MKHAYLRETTGVILISNVLESKEVKLQILDGIYLSYTTTVNEIIPLMTEHNQYAQKQ